MAAIVAIAPPRFHAMTRSETRFPYMFWAQSEAFTAPFCLAASGMPAPDVALLGADARAAALDLAPAPIDALPALEARLAALFGVDRERVLVTAGATGAMHLAAMRFFPAAHVVTEVPSYEPFRALSRLYGASTTIVERREAAGFALDVDLASAALAGQSRPAHLFLCSPHNPTGAVTSPEHLVELARRADDAGGLLIVNEAYMEFASPERRFHAFELAPNAVSIGTLTKAYGLGALRIGWIVLGEGLQKERASLVDLAFLVGLDPPTPSLRLARIALDHLEALLAPVRTYETICRPRLERWLATTPGVRGTLGPHGLCAFPRIEGVDDTRTLVRHLMDTEGVSAVPGEFFGAPGYVRIGYGVPEATLVEGLARIARGIGR